jgi:hypothetical protein
VKFLENAPTSDLLIVAFLNKANTSKISGEYDLYQGADQKFEIVLIV